MFDILEQVENEMPALLQRNDWQSLYINYHQPIVERLWISWNEYRINLHRIHPCGTDYALWHNHPWPSIIKIISQGYWSAIGYSHQNKEPPRAAGLWLPVGSIVNMPSSDAYHLVAPEKFAHSLMITGKPFDKKPNYKPGLKLRSMNEQEIFNLKSFFLSKYLISKI